MVVGKTGRAEVLQRKDTCVHVFSVLLLNPANGFHRQWIKQCPVRPCLVFQSAWRFGTFSRRRSSATVRQQRWCVMSLVHRCPWWCGTTRTGRSRKSITVSFQGLWLDTLYTSIAVCNKEMYFYEKYCHKISNLVGNFKRYWGRGWIWWSYFSLLAQCKICCVLVSKTDNAIKVAISCAKLRFQCKLVKSLSNIEWWLKCFQSKHVQIPLSLRRCISVPKILLMKMPFFFPFV